MSIEVSIQSSERMMHFEDYYKIKEHTMKGSV